MNCYYHAERDAVGTCQDCGIALCKECASKYTPCLCPDCADKRMQSEEVMMEKNKIKHMENVKNEFLVTLIPALICGVIFACFPLFSGGSGVAQSAICMFFVGFFLVYGWKQSVVVKYSDPNNVMAGILSFILRIGFSVVLGIPSFIFSLVKFVKGREDNRKM